MVDFRKRLQKKNIVRKVDPIEIYDSLDRRSETGPLRPSQEAILKNWFENKDERDHIIKLHTGDGKTLIGLLILQSQINSNSGPCLYICPNIYLADQVKAEAEKFGIHYSVITESNDLPDDFLDGKTILITYVQKVFNGRTIFGRNNKSIKIGSVILDDSHACIDSIQNSLRITLKKDHSLYNKFINLFENELREQGEGSFLEIQSGDYNTFLPIPYWSWFEKKDEVIKLIVQNKDDQEIKFVWPIIKDHLDNCQAFISGSYIEINPYLLPIRTFGSFHKAEHRILMSATTQDDSFFIKGLGLSVSAVKNPLTDKRLKWSGEKMLLLPSQIDPEFDRDKVIHWIMGLDNKNTCGIVFLTPNFKSKGQYEKLGAVFASSENIYTLVKDLKSGNFDRKVIFGNRYDGIDLPDNSCRILVLDSKPFFDSLLDRYESECRTDSDSINIRIAQKVEQGLGRSVRGEKDYSVIIIAGSDLVKFIKSSKTNKYFSNQTRKQIDIGLQVASFAEEEIEEESNTKKVLISLINNSLKRDDGWKAFYTEEMNKIENHKDSNSLYELLQKEFEAETQFFMQRYEESCEIMQDICDYLNDDLLEKGWYLQNLARYKYRISKTESNSFQKSAFQLNEQLLKPKDGINYKKIEFINENRINRIKTWISQFRNYEEMMLSVESIRDNLSFGMLPEKFELALKDLGEAIGFISQRPDKKIKKGPDNLWCGVENQYFLIECKNKVKETRESITKDEAGQMNTHCAWFDKEYGQAKCKRILIIQTKNLSYYADFTHEVEIMRKSKLKHLKKNFKDFFKEFSRYSMNDISDAKIQSFIDQHKLDIVSLKSIYSEKYYHQKK